MTIPTTSNQINPDSLERERIDIEMAKAEFEMNNALIESEIQKMRLETERERLELEKSKAQLDRSFFRSNSGILITAAVSLAAVIVSLSQVWITKLTKDKELEIASIQKKSELDLQDKQKERELMLLDAQKKREWDLSAARFITDNRRAIFNGTPDEQELFAKIIGTIYPADVSAYILERIEKASPPAAKKTWREARKAIEQADMTESAEVEKSQPEQDLRQDVVPSNRVFIRNVSNQKIPFFLRKGNNEWVPFVLEPQTYNAFKGVDQIQILTVGQEPVYSKLESGGTYTLFWNGTRWVIERIQIR